ncbi:efflux RND transporter periplasmic adaptor subunit [Roseateles cellulosilyticus]|uniref:Efflux RND transporter periplasmic adaptor subunit n=1 Tax=Pelomonas cellulosilytica TaxID=2906762 RepID=A0ABS8XUU9_9BURK|nr:efflux RND transporter periplasmic adaptor subunit [Pelomonas sp. P8]MCE4555070.1 efflux RND transporter periplasmic adaptor subunit [Pelomonas sp. P8]
MAITKKQRVAMAIIVLTGLLAGGGLLLTERHKTGEEAEQGEEAGHAHKEGDDDKKSAPAAKEAHEEREERSVKLTEDQVKKAGIAVQAAGPAKLQAAAEFTGEIRFNEDRTAHVVPRLAGVAEQVVANLGQSVRKGEVLAVIASNSLSEQRSELLTAKERRDAARVTYEREKKLWQEKISAEQDYLQAQSALREADIAVRNATQKLAAVGATGSSANLNRFELRAPFDGTVVEKHLALGEAVKEDASIFTVSDLRSVWAEFNVAPKDLATVRVGQRVSVSSTAFESKVEGTISYVGALLGEQTRTARARVTLTNPDGAWRPGLFVTVSVFGENQDVPLTVPADAVQTIENQTMAFKAVSGGFEATPIKVGRSDGHVVEILSGLKSGDQVASKNTFILKSELGKASAGHEH